MLQTDMKAVFQRSGMTQAELAKRLGISVGSLNNYLNGRQPIPGHVLDRLALLADAHRILTPGGYPHGSTMYA